MLPNTYFQKILRHSFGTTRVPFRDPSVREFMVKQLCIVLVADLIKYCIFYEPAKEFYLLHVKKDTAKLLEGADWGDSPRVVEMIGERNWEGKATCTAMRRAVVEAKVARGTIKKLAFPDCVMRDFFRVVCGANFVVTWPAAEFDATAALRRNGGAHVIVSSCDSDLPLYVMGNTACTGVLYFPEAQAAVNSTLLVFDTNHKIANLSAHFSADRDTVTSNFNFYEMALLMAAMHGPQDYHARVTVRDGKQAYTMATNLGLKGIPKFTEAFAKRMPAAIAAAAASSPPQNPLFVLASELLRCHSDSDSVGGRSLCGRTPAVPTFLPHGESVIQEDGSTSCGLMDGVRRGFFEHPVSPDSGCNSNEHHGPYAESDIDVDHHVGDGQVPDWVDEYIYTHPCPTDESDNCQCPNQFEKGWSLPIKTKGKVDSLVKLGPDGEERHFTPVDWVPRSYAGQVVNHMTSTIYSDKAAQSGSYDGVSEYIDLIERAGMVNNVRMCELDITIDGDPCGRKSIPAGHKLVAFLFGAPQSYGIPGKEKGKMERSASDLYTACIVVEMISADCAIVPPGPLGASRVGDGYLWSV
jgi:hypothetical protein